MQLSESAASPESLQSFFSLNDARKIPVLGIGTWQMSDAQAAGAIATALEAGYRSIDTAAIYQNETGVGDALRCASVPRAGSYVTTKLWNSEHGYDSTLRAADASLKRLGLDYVDLYLIHWPLPVRGKFVETWRALIALRDAGKVRSIGVSNFAVPHLEKIIGETGVVPAVNQIELHPQLAQNELREFHRQHGIVTESWSPLGQGQLLSNDIVVRIARRLGKTPAQVILRWHFENGLVAIPKSVTPARIRENAAIFDFRLAPEDFSAIAELNIGKRIGPDPETFDMA